VDFLSKIKSGASGMTKQAQTMIEVTRLNAQISEKRSSIQSKFRDIGQQVYTRLQSSEESVLDDSIRQLCTEIQGIELEIQRLNEKINELKGLKPCPYCKNVVEAGAKFCPNCGAAIPDVESEAVPKDTRTCPKCNAAFDVSTKFCTKCGTALQDQALSEVAATTDPKNCPSCGVAVQVDARFCTGCGKPL